MMPTRLLVLALVTIIIAFPAAAKRDDRQQALDAVSRDLCNRQLVILGEPGNHGNGETLAFKADLLERLVRRCGFSVVFFESSFYDFAEFGRLAKAGEAGGRDRLVSSIGRLWTLDREFDPVITFLNDQVAAGRIKVGGLDNGVGSAGAFYSLENMPKEFVRRLPASQRDHCYAAFRQRIDYDYPADRPYSPLDKAAILACVDAIEAVDATVRVADPLRRQMLRNFRRTIEPDFGDWTASRQARGTAMFDNLQWHLRGLPAGTKAIVWTATVHGMRSTAMDERWRAIDDLGAQISRAYGDRAFVLGFAAAGGTYREASPVPKPIETAPADSLEASALGDRRTVAYVDSTRLAAMGTISAALFSPGKRLTTRWRDAVDGVVVFRTERPPVRRTP